jgi:plasmid stability protein
MAHIQIRNVPPELDQKLKSRAAEAAEIVVAADTRLARSQGHRAEILAP